MSKSINTIAVEVLLQTGIEKTIVHARNLGIKSELPQYPSLALGSADIPLSEMILPYMCFANAGKLMTPYYLLEIRDQSGTVLYQAPVPESKEVLPSQEAYVMSNILSAVINEGTGRRLRTTYGLKNELAGKTGTTQNQADGWFIGYNSRIVVGIRVGANDRNIHFNSIRLGQGAHMALPIFGLFMRECLKDPAYARWESLSFPLVPVAEQKELDTPIFQEKMNLFERIGNKKLKKRALVHPTDTVVKKEKKGFFRKIGNLFRKKKEEE